MKKIIPLKKINVSSKISLLRSVQKKTVESGVRVNGASSELFPQEAAGGREPPQAIWQLTPLPRSGGRLQYLPLLHNCVQNRQPPCFRKKAFFFSTQKQETVL